MEETNHGNDPGAAGAAEARSRKQGREHDAGAAVPAANDIFETGLALTLILEMPDVDENSVDVKVENDVLSIEGRVDFSKYNGLQPLYTERGPLRPQLPAFEQDRARGDQRRARGRGHDAGAAQSRKRQSRAR